MKLHLFLVAAFILPASPIVTVSGSVACSPNEGAAVQRSLTGTGEVQCSLSGGGLARAAAVSSDFSMSATMEGWAGLGRPGSFAASLEMAWRNTFVVPGNGRSGAGELGYFFLEMRDTYRRRCPSGLLVDGAAVECGAPIAFTYDRPFEVSLSLDWSIGPSVQAMPLGGSFGFWLDSSLVEQAKAAEVSLADFDGERVVSNPEPSTWILLAVGLGGLWMAKGRR